MRYGLVIRMRNELLQNPDGRYSLPAPSVCRLELSVVATFSKHSLAIPVDRYRVRQYLDLADRH